RPGDGVDGGCGGCARSIAAHCPGPLGNDELLETHRVDVDADAPWWARRGPECIAQRAMVWRSQQPRALDRSEHLDAERRAERFDELRRRRTRYLGQRAERRELQLTAALAFVVDHATGIGVQPRVGHRV